jgi:hypothetical protein
LFPVTAHSSARHTLLSVSFIHHEEIDKGRSQLITSLRPTLRPIISLKPNMSHNKAADDIEKVDVVDTVYPAHTHDPLDSKHLDQAHDKRYDAAAGFLADLATRPDAEQLMAPWTEEEERAVVRKVSRPGLGLLCSV